MKTLDRLNVRGKTVFVRVDINSPVENGRLMDSERIAAHAKTIKELSSKGAKLVVLGHQGRAGDPDFLPLKGHAALLRKHVGKRIEFVSDVIGPTAVRAIKDLKSGEILLLDNVRLMAEESLELDPPAHSKSIFIKTLAPLGDYFVCDAFSAAHRSHASVVGLTHYLDSFSGRVMQHEVEHLSKFLGTVKRPFVMVMSGKKPEEVLDIINNLGPKADKILVGGVIGELFLLASGKRLGKKEEWLKDKGLLLKQDTVKKLYDKFKDKLVVPVDFGVEVAGKRKDIALRDLPSEYPTMDIGPKTVELFAAEIRKAKMLVMKGPLGTYEKSGFEKGTLGVLRAVEHCTAYSLLGGGDTSTVVKKLRIKKDKISYISLAGGAMIEYLSGKKLPGVEALR